jgi:hypothetical protein
LFITTLGGKKIMNPLKILSKEERIALFYESLQLVNNDEDVNDLISDETITSILEGLENKKLVPSDMGGCWKLTSRACKKLAVFYS